MKTCAQCKGRIADDTKVCPHCGTHSPHKYLWSDPKVIITFVVIFIICIGACSGG